MNEAEKAVWYAVLLEQTKALYKKYIDGHKTQSIVIAIIVLASLQGVNLVAVPAYAWKVICATALWALRDGVKKTEVTAKSTTTEE